MRFIGWVVRPKNGLLVQPYIVYGQTKKIRRPASSCQGKIGFPAAPRGAGRPVPGRRRRSRRRKGGRHPGVHSRKIPAFEDRCIPADFVALPHRTAEGTPRLGASPVGAHRPSRCTASSATDPWTPGGAFREEGQAQTCGCIASRATKRATPLRGCGSRSCRGGRKGKGAAAHGCRNPLEVTGWQGPSSRALPSTLHLVS